MSLTQRVMPSGWLVLQRFFLRVDDVVFRVFDTRMYVSFDPHDGDAVPGTRDTVPRVIRECRGLQAPYAVVKQRLPLYRTRDLSLLTQVPWVVEQLERYAARNGAACAPPPATVPGPTRGTPSAAILGEVGASSSSSDLAWPGEGWHVDVAVLSRDSPT